jgi:ubiquinone/menaquinone biosynthesis C-methylase UbiE
VKAHQWHYYDENERRKWQKPEEILQQIGLKTDQTLVDLGCGEGFFALPAARLVGPGGLVYCLDPNPSALESLSQKAAAEGLKNIRLISQDAESAEICDGCADFIFLGLVLHDFRDALQALKNARQMLKPDGHLANLDWRKSPMTMGPPLEKRFDETTAAGILNQAGFKVQKIQNYGEYNYLISATI